MMNWLIENTVIAALLSAAVVAVGPLLRSRPAVLHVLWLVVLVKLCAPPLVRWDAIAGIELRLDAQSGALHAADAARPALAVERASASAAAAMPRAARGAEGNGIATPVSKPRPTAERQVVAPAVAISRWWFAGWLAGAFGLVLWSARRALRAARVCRAQSAPEQSLVREVEEIAGQLRMRPPRVCCPRALRVPCVGGLLRTRLYWPAGGVALEPRLRAAVLAHELAHLQRRDHWVARLEAIGAVLHWWNPLFWWMRLRLRECAEQACDARALRVRPVAPRQYVEALMTLSAHGPQPVLAAAARSPGLAAFRRRMTAVMRPGGTRPSARGGRAVAMALVLVSLPVWSGTAQEPGPTSRQEPATPLAAGDGIGTEWVIVGRVVHVSGDVVTIELAPGVRLPDGETQLWLCDQKTPLTVAHVEDRVVFGRSAAGVAVAVGAEVCRREAIEWPRVAARVRHVARRVTTLELLGAVALPRQIAADEPVAVSMGKVRRTGRIVLADDEYLFVSVSGEPPWSVGEAVVLTMDLAQKPLVRNGALGAPLAPPPAAPTCTLVADYSDNRLLQLDANGRVTHDQREIYGAWDVEPIGTDRWLVTEFSVSRVSEIDLAGNLHWSYENLRNPYDADRLPNGNTLIANTFAGEVIEVSPDGKIVWRYDTEIRPFDVERLANGNTLIGDTLGDRVLEVAPDGELVWEVRDLPSVHDVDRLVNGNTLVTLRTLNAVWEIDPDGVVVAKLQDLNAPSDADRLANGHTLVAENAHVREFDAQGEEVWRAPSTWAVEASRY